MVNSAGTVAGRYGAFWLTVVLVIACTDGTSSAGHDTEGGDGTGSSGAPVSDGSAGTSSAASTLQVLAISGADNGSELTAVVGQEIDITLQSIGPGSYGTAAISSSSVEFIDMSYPSAQTPAGPKQLFRFRAVASGEAVITMEHTETLDGLASNSPFTVRITVE
jgi:hypothetical protein